MGSTLLRGWLQQDHLFHKIIVVAPHQEQVTPFLTDQRVSWVDHPSKIKDRSDIILFAVKPQILPQIITLYQRFISESPLFLTVVAGLGMDFYQSNFPQASIIRIMPNTPTTILKGISGLYANSFTNEMQQDIATHLMQQVGLVVWTQSDQQIDVLTAVSGCGPAYVFLLAEALQHAAERLGFDSTKAAMLAKQTVVGSAAYLEQSADPPSELRRQVTSPGGMTEAAVASLQKEGQFDIIVVEAIQAALKRAAELKAN